MNIHIKTKNYDLTDNVRSYIEEKLSHLEKYIPQKEDAGEVLAEVEVGRRNNHHNKGNIYRAEINIMRGKKMLRAVAKNDSLMSAIDTARDEMARRLRRTEGRATSLIKRGAQRAKQLFRRGK